MSQKVIDILTPIGLIILTAIGGLVVNVVRLYTSKLQLQIMKIKNETDRQFTEEVLKSAESCVETAVIKTNQVLVDNLKQKSEDGKLTPSDVNQSFQKTYNTALQLMGEEAQTQLKALLPDFEHWMRSKIEYYVNQKK